MVGTEIFTILNPNSIDGDHVPGGVPEITAQDVDFAMSGAPNGMWRLALVKLCGRSEETRNLYYALSVAAAGKKSVNRWVLKNKGYLELLCILAIDELTGAAKCKSCGGSGSRRIKKVKLVSCEFCRGTGHKGLDIRVKSKAIGVSRQDWNKYRVVYDQIFDILTAWDLGIRKRINRRLK